MPGSLEAVRHVVLVGLMGSGKTTIGRMLARRLAIPFRDSDAGIEARTGRTVRDLQLELGDDAMHRIEADELVAALDGAVASVIAAAASTIESAACRTALAGPDVAVVWLRGSVEVLARRFGSSRHRPSFGADVAGFLREQARRREPLFELVALLTVDIDDMTPNGVVEAILASPAIGRAIDPS
jgi:shikimate kinase